MEHEVASSSDSSKDDGCATIFETHGIKRLYATTLGTKRRVRNALGFMAEFTA